MFIEPREIKEIYLHLEFVDFRKGIIGLCSHISEEFGDSVKGKNLFVFCNRSRDKLRVLYWDDTGYALWHKALESDKFKWPKNLGERFIVSIEQLKWLLCGLSIEEVKPHKKRLAKAFF